MFQLIIGFVLGIFATFGFMSILICIGGVDVEDCSMGNADNNTVDDIVILDLNEDRG